MIHHLALEGVAEGSLGVGIDVVGAAARLVATGLGRAPPGSLRQRVVSVEGEAVRSGTDRPVSVDAAFRLRPMNRGDVLVVPGIFAAEERALETILARPDVSRAARLVAGAAERGVLVAASCSATFVLGAAGVLAGRAATTTWWLASAFARRFPDVELDARRVVVADGGVVTAGSAFAHADLMLAVVARVAGPTLAQLVSRYLLLDERASQARYVVMSQLRSSDGAVRAVERFVRAHLERQVRLDELARAASLSPRTLARRVHASTGLTPLELSQRVRVHHAARLLETTDASVELVAAQVGYADPAAFRRVYRRHMGESPRGRR